MHRHQETGGLSGSASDRVRSTPMKARKASGLAPSRPLSAMPGSAPRAGFGVVSIGLSMSQTPALGALDRLAVLALAVPELFAASSADWRWSDRRITASR